MTAKEFLSSPGLAFEEKGIRSEPESLRELVEEFHNQAPPALVVGDKVVEGFDPAEYEIALHGI